jgi:hypothetical protein
VVAVSGSCFQCNSPADYQCMGWSQGRQGREGKGRGGGALVQVSGRAVRLEAEILEL